MWTYNSNDELAHYGVKGMKWGHRKGPSVTGGSGKSRIGSIGTVVKKDPAGSPKSTIDKIKKKTKIPESFDELVNTRHVKNSKVAKGAKKVKEILDSFSTTKDGPYGGRKKPGGRI